jgi:hypothetical protein
MIWHVIFVFVNFQYFCQKRVFINLWLFSSDDGVMFIFSVERSKTDDFKVFHLKIIAIPFEKMLQNMDLICIISN